MYAIVEIAGQQFKVTQDQYVYVHRLNAAEGAALTFDKVLLIEDGSTIQVGAPTVAGASIAAKVLDHVRGEKVLVFKKKRRKGFRKSRGHRQDFTKILIEGITF
jgi:large subunit ribosomal protein L21